MSKAILFMKLDFVTVKPYLSGKNLMIFVAIALIMTITNRSAAGTVSILMALAAMYASYPFAIGDKSNIDVLYATLSIRRDTVVLGRYIYAVIFEICMALAAFALSFAIMTVLGNEFKAVETLTIMLALFMMFSLIQAIQLPIYFKLSYTKAKFLAYLPFFVMPLAIVAGSNLLRDNISFDWFLDIFRRITSNAALTALLIAVIWFGMMGLSYRLSLGFYRKREF